MGSELSAKFYDLLQKHLETGVPVSDMAFSEEQKQRAMICLDVHRRLEENDMMDVDKYLRNKYQRTTTQIRQDKKVINYLLAELNGESKELSRYRIRRVAEKTIRMGEASGDWKPMIEGAKMLHKIEGLDKPETAEDIEQGTLKMPDVIVYTGDFTKVNPDAQHYSEADIERLRKKYHVQKDKTQEMVEAKLNLFIPAGSTLEEEDFTEDITPSDTTLSDFLSFSTPSDTPTPSDPLALSTLSDITTPSNPLTPSNPPQYFINDDE